MLGRILKTAVASTALVLTSFAQTIPAGTHISVRMGQEISSGTAKVGDRFDDTLARSIVVDGKTIARAGAPVRGKVTLAKSRGRLHAPGQISVRLTSIQAEGKTDSIST